MVLQAVSNLLTRIHYEETKDSSLTFSMNGGVPVTAADAQATPDQRSGFRWPRQTVRRPSARIEEAA